MWSFPAINNEEERAADRSVRTARDTPLGRRVRHAGWPVSHDLGDPNRLCRRRFADRTRRARLTRRGRLKALSGDVSHPCSSARYKMFKIGQIRALYVLLTGGQTCASCPVSEDLGSRVCVSETRPTQVKYMDVHLGRALSGCALRGRCCNWSHRRVWRAPRAVGCRN